MKVIVADIQSTQIKVIGLEDNIGDNADDSCTLNTCPAHCLLDDELLTNTSYFGVSNGNVFSLSDGINNIDELFNADTTDKQTFVDGINTYMSLNDSGLLLINNSVAVVDKLRLDMIPNASGISISDINASNSSDYSLIDFKCGDGVYTYGDYKLPNVIGKLL